MIIADQHMHSLCSPDGTASLEEMADAAVRAGLQSITFTEHMDMDFPYDPWPELDTLGYRARFLRAQQEFVGRLELGWGVEFGMQPHLVERGQAFIRSNPFDFVIASGHTTHGKLPTSQSFFQGRPKQEALQEYFADLAHNLALFDDYDVCGHIDYLLRYAPGTDTDCSSADYADLVDQILTILVDKGKGVEVNTGAYRYGMQEPNPCRNILRRFRELGGQIVTIGSDAHCPQDVGGGFDLARQVLLDCGFDHYAVFHRRQPTFIAL